VIDCDVHPAYNDLNEIVEYMDPGYRSFMQNAGHGGFELPALPWLNLHGFHRRDAEPEGGGMPGSDLGLMREQALDGRGIEYAVLIAETIIGIGSLPNATLAAAMATGYNRWMTERFLEQDERLKGSLLVAPQDPTAAAAEIRAYAGNPDIVAVLLPSSSTQGYGHPQFDPIYAAADEAGFAVMTHPASEGCGINPSPTPCGYPQYYIEWHTLLCLSSMTHVVSLVCNGTFEKFPNLQFGIIEAGFTWLPSILWRLDSNWKALRAEVPWVKQLPSEIAAEHMFFGTQPMPEPPNGRQLIDQLEAFPAFERMLVYGTDYPHWDADEPELGLRRLPAAWRDAVASENARRVFNLPSSVRIPAAAVEND
jgi:predicted TIM-barrel fold metal-dependent hydrolase